jgi:hypothetical protein
VTYFIKSYLYTSCSWWRESYLDPKYAYYNVEVYRFFEKPIAEKMVSVQTVNAKCGLNVPFSEACPWLTRLCICINGWPMIAQMQILESLCHSKLTTLILDRFYQIINAFLNAKLCNIDVLQWLKQLRYVTSAKQHRNYA